MRACFKALLIVAPLTAFSCKPQIAPPAKPRAPNGPIVGRWHGGMAPPRGVFLEFKKDSTFSFQRYWTDVKGPQTTMSGAYRLVADKLTVNAQKLKTNAPKGANPKIKQYLHEQDERAMQSGKGAADLNGTVTWHGKDAFILNPEANLAMEFVRLPLKEPNASARQPKK